MRNFLLILPIFFIIGACDGNTDKNDTNKKTWLQVSKERCGDGYLSVGKQNEPDTYCIPYKTVNELAEERFKK